MSLNQNTEHDYNLLMAVAMILNKNQAFPHTTMQSALTIIASSEMGSQSSLYFVFTYAFSQ